MRPRLKLGRRGVLAGVAAVAVGGGALAAALVSSGGSGAVPPKNPIEAQGTLSPSIAFFGDTVSARLDVTLDRSRVDPGSVRVQADFTPWKLVVSPRRVRRDGETTTDIRTTFVLRCLESACTSQNDSAVQDFSRARVSYTSRDGSGRSDKRVLQVPWPQLVVDSRYAPKTIQAAGSRAAPWKADLLSLPPASYSISPLLLFALLLAGSTVLVLGAGGLAYAARPRPAARPAPTRPQRPPAPVLTPLERALALLEVSERVDGAGDQRRALERIALELAKRGETELAHAARALAWSESGPEPEETHGVAAHARSTLSEELYAPRQ